MEIDRRNCVTKLSSLKMHNTIINRNIRVVNDMMGGEGANEAAIFGPVSIPFHCFGTKRNMFPVGLEKLLQTP